MANGTKLRLGVFTWPSGRGAREAAGGVECAGGDLLAKRAGRVGEATTRLVEDAVRVLGGLNVRVNGAGDPVQRRSIEQLVPEYWARMRAVNLNSMVWVTRAAVPVLAKAGGASIVNLALLAGRKGGHPGSLAYSTAKGAVLTWTRALAGARADRGIRVNAVAPGFILGTRFPATHTTGESARQTIAQIPLRRAGTPDDVARAVVFRASESNGFIPGATLDVNGGVYLA